MMVGKAKFFLNEKSLKLRELSRNAHHKKEVERRSEKLSLKPHHTKVTVPKKIGTVFFFFFFSCKVCLCLADLYAINFLFVCVKFARCSRKGHY